MNILYSKNVNLPTPRSAQTTTSSKRMQLLSLAEEKLEAGLFAAELHGIIRSALFATSVPAANSEKDYIKRYWTLLLGLCKKEDILYFRVFCVLSNGEHVLIAEDKSLSKVIKEANQVFRERSGEISDTNFGVSLFEEAEFYDNLELCLEDPNQFYSKREVTSKENNKGISSYFWNGRVPVQYSLEHFQEDFQKNIWAWKYRLEKEIGPRGVDYFMFQSPFFPQSFEEEGQKEVRKSFFLKLIKQEVGDDYFEKHSKLLSFYEKLVGPINVQTQNKLFELLAEEVEDKFQSVYKNFLMKNYWAPYAKIMALAMFNYQKEFASILAREIIYKLIPNHYYEEEQEERFKRLLNHLHPFSYSRLKKKYTKIHKERVAKTDTFYLNKQIKWSSLQNTITEYLIDLKENRKNDDFYQQIKVQLFGV